MTLQQGRGRGANTGCAAQSPCPASDPATCLLSPVPSGNWPSAHRWPFTPADARPRARNSTENASAQSLQKWTCVVQACVTQGSPVTQQLHLGLRGKDMTLGDFPHRPWPGQPRSLRPRCSTAGEPACPPARPSGARAGGPLRTTRWAPGKPVQGA